MINQAASSTVPPISGVIISFNEQQRIAAAIESLKCFCAEVLVLDSFSTDATCAIARDCGARVLQQEFLGHQAQKNRAIELAEHDWIFSLDADEVLATDPPLALGSVDWLRTEKVYRIARRNWYLGGWVDHTGWRRDSSVRLFHRSKARFGGSTVHDRAGGPDCVEQRIAGLLHHWPYRDLSHHMQKIDAYTSALALEMQANGRAPSMTKLLFDPPWKFVREFILLGGWRMGLKGLVLSAMAAWYVFGKYAKLWELSHNNKNSDDSR